MSSLLLLFLNLQIMLPFDNDLVVSLMHFADHSEVHLVDARESLDIEARLRDDLKQG